ncbi:MAG: hypothetical protein JOY80_02310, partial [Candidatus Dormibacteraeota bacterium]|nr:hypothetical protein [Candidatus Dormibacteraeota bacterium]
MSPIFVKSLDVLRRFGRVLRLALWFGIDGGWIYYAILLVYGVLVTAAVFLLTQPGWLHVLLALFILLDGLTLMLVLLYRWLNRR